MSYAPPGARLSAVRVADPGRLLGPPRRDAAAVAARAHERIRPAGAAVLGPAALFRLRGRARVQLVVKAVDRAAAIASVRGAVDAVAPGDRLGTESMSRWTSTHSDVGVI